MSGLKALFDLVIVTIWLMSLSVLFAVAGIFHAVMHLGFKAWVRVKRVWADKVKTTQ